MSDSGLELKIGTAIDEDGTVRLGVFADGETLGEKVMSQDELASMAAYRHSDSPGIFPQLESQSRINVES